MIFSALALIDASFVRLMSCSLLGVLAVSCVGSGEQLFPVEEISEDEFKAELYVVCNRFFDREVGLKFEPPLESEVLVDKEEIASGVVSIEIAQGEQRLTERVGLSDNTWWWSDGGVKYITLFRFSPIEGFFCTRQHIEIMGRLSLLGSEETKVSIYISRDRRP